MGGMECIQDSGDVFLKAWSISLQNIYVVKSKKSVLNKTPSCIIPIYVSVTNSWVLRKAKLAPLNSLVNVIAAAYQRRQKHPLNTTLNPNIYCTYYVYTSIFFCIIILHAWEKYKLYPHAKEKYKDVLLKEPYLVLFLQQFYCKTNGDLFNLQ